MTPKLPVLLAAACCLLAPEALAANTIVGTIPPYTMHGTGWDGQPSTGTIEASFTCTGSPTCTGSYTMKDRFIGCPNTFLFSGNFVATGWTPAVRGRSRDR